MWQSGVFYVSYDTGLSVGMHVTLDAIKEDILENFYKFIKNPLTVAKWFGIIIKRSDERTWDKASIQYVK